MKNTLKKYFNDLKRFSNDYYFDLEKPIDIREYRNKKTTEKAILEDFDYKEEKIIILYEYCEKFAIATIDKYGKLDTISNDYNCLKNRIYYTKKELNDIRKYCVHYIVIAQEKRNLRKTKKSTDDFGRIDKKDMFVWGTYDHSGYDLNHYRYELEDRLAKYKKNNKENELKRFDGSYYESYINTGYNTILNMISNKKPNFTNIEDLEKYADSIRDLKYKVRNLCGFKKDQYSSVDSFKYGFENCQRYINECFTILEKM